MIAPLLALAAGLSTDGIPARSTEFAMLGSSNSGYPDVSNSGRGALCPQWAHDYATSGDYSTYAYNELEWGKTGAISNCLNWGCTPYYRNPNGGYLTGIGAQPPAGTPLSNEIKRAATSSACAWVAACMQTANADNKDYCMKRTAAAMGVIYGESAFSPIAQAWDGNGRGLIQFDYYNSVDGAVSTSGSRRRIYLSISISISIYISIGLFIHII